MPDQTIGVIGLGKIAMPIALQLIRSGYAVTGYRRSSMAEFAAAGGTPLSSPAEVALKSDFIVSCLPSPDALDDVIAGPGGVMNTIRPGQIFLELGTYPLAVKERQRARLAEKNATFIDGEISGTPVMVANRKSSVFLAGDEAACAKAAEVVKGFTDACTYFGAFGASIQVTLIANLLVSIHIAAAGEAMAIGLRTGIDPKVLIGAIMSGAGASAQLGARAGMMAEKRYEPPLGAFEVLKHYFAPAKEMASGLGVATPMFDRAIELYERGLAEGWAGKDVAAIVEVIGGLRAR